MSAINATTGHSRPQEKRVAKSLYATIIIVVLACMALFFVLGQQRNLDPTNLDKAAPAAPTPSTTPTEPAGP